MRDVDDIIFPKKKRQSPRDERARDKKNLHPYGREGSPHHSSYRRSTSRSPQRQPMRRSGDNRYDDRSRNFIQPTQRSQQYYPSYQIQPNHQNQTHYRNELSNGNYFQRNFNQQQFPSNMPFYPMQCQNMWGGGMPQHGYVSSSFLEGEG